MILVQPTRPDSPVMRFPRKHGEGFFHMAIEVDDIESRARTLQQQGIGLDNETPRIGIDGWKLIDIELNETLGAMMQLVEVRRELRWRIRNESPSSRSDRGTAFRSNASSSPPSSRSRSSMPSPAPAFRRSKRPRSSARSSCPSSPMRPTSSPPSIVARDPLHGPGAESQGCGTGPRSRRRRGSPGGHHHRNLQQEERRHDRRPVARGLPADSRPSSKTSRSRSRRSSRSPSVVPSRARSARTAWRNSPTVSSIWDP